MALGDGIRRNIMTVSPQERQRFINAIKQLNQGLHFPGSRTDFPAGGVSYWFKQDEIHQATHIHGVPAFLPWHRELCNRFETMLRAADPQLSLHYWDWNTDPAPLFTPDFMGNADGGVNEGSVGEPLLSAGFYLLNPSDPDPADGKFRDNISPVFLNKPNVNDPSTWSYPDPSVPPHIHYNPADPPKTLTRNKQAGPPPVGTPSWPSDSDLINAATFEAFDKLTPGLGPGAHGSAHVYIGGNLAEPHLSFRDPFVFLLHSNLDRLWARWQTQPGHSVRLDPNHVYGAYSNDPSITSPLQPWAGTGDWPTRPWYPPENQQAAKNCKDHSVVLPPRYDTNLLLPSGSLRQFLRARGINPSRGIRAPMRNASFSSVRAFMGS